MTDLSVTHRQWLLRTIAEARSTTIGRALVASVIASPEHPETKIRVAQILDQIPGQSEADTREMLRQAQIDPDQTLGQLLPGPRISLCAVLNGAAP